MVAAPAVQGVSLVAETQSTQDTVFVKAVKLFNHTIKCTYCENTTVHDKKITSFYFV